MQLRKDIPEIYKWDIGLFKTEEEIEKALKVIEESTENANKYYGKFNNKDIFFDYFYSNLDTYILTHKVKRFNSLLKYVILFLQLFFHILL